MLIARWQAYPKDSSRKVVRSLILTQDPQSMCVAECLMGGDSDTSGRECRGLMRHVMRSPFGGWSSVAGMWAVLASPVTGLIRNHRVGRSIGSLRAQRVRAQDRRWWEEVQVHLVSGPFRRRSDRVGARANSTPSRPAHTHPGRLGTRCQSRYQSDAHLCKASRRASAVS